MSEQDEQHMEESAIILAIDIGTSGCRAFSCKQDGVVLASADKAYGFSCNDKGFAEQDPELIFNSFLEVVNKCIAETHDEIDFVVIGSVLHSLLLLDIEGTPLTPLSICTDTRALAQCRLMHPTYEQSRLHVRTGCLLSPTYPLYRLMWYKENEPQLFEQFHKAVSIKSYIHYRLFGIYCEDHSVASGSGMFNIHKRSWDTNILNYLQMNEMRLPEAVPIEYQLPVSSYDSTGIHGLSEQTKWLVGGADGPMAHLGTAGFNLKVASLTIGTSAAVRLVTKSPLSSESSPLWCYVLNSDSYILGMASNNGGNVLDWFLKTFFQEGMEWHLIEKRLASAAFDPELLFIPTLFRERNNLNSASSSAHFYGLKQWHGRDELLRAVVEGIVFNAIFMLDKLRSNYNSIEAIAVSGSLANSIFVKKILLATIFLPIIEGSVGNATLRGLAYIVNGTTPLNSIERNMTMRRNTERDIDEHFGDTNNTYSKKYFNWENNLQHLY